MRRTTRTRAPAAKVTDANNIAAFVTDKGVVSSTRNTSTKEKPTFTNPVEAISKGKAKGRVAAKSSANKPVAARKSAATLEGEQASMYLVHSNASVTHL